MNKRKLTLLSACCVLWLYQPAAAQMNTGALQDPHQSNNAARYLPSFLGDGFKTLQVSVLNAYVAAGSNFMTAKDARKYISGNEITNEMIDQSIGRLNNKENIIQLGVDVSILNVAFNIGNKSGHPVFSVGFGASERVETSSGFNKELFQLAYKGNKQFAGRTIELSPRLNGLAYTDYYVSAAASLKLPGTAIGIKPGVRLRYLSGQASISMPNTSSITMYTDPDGRYIDFGLHYEVNSSMSSDTISLSGKSLRLDESSFRQGAGSGLGLDLSVRVNPLENLSLNIGVTDIGSMRFTKNAVNMKNDTLYRYRGADISFSGDQPVTLDSIAGLGDPKYSYNNYRVKLPARLILSASLGLGKSEIKNLTYYKHNLTFTYLQGFANYLSATKTPYVALGYTHSFGNVVNLGANASVGGLWGPGVGALVSFKAGALRFGFNSNNLLPLIAPKSGKGADFGFMLAFGS